MEPCVRGKRRLWFLVPGDLDTPTGGYRYDRRIIEGLRALDWRVEHRTLDGGFPSPSPSALAHARGVLSGIPDQETVVVDGLAFGALPDLAGVLARRLRLIALVHHPLWMETGLDAGWSESLRRSETRALVAASRVVATSTATAQLLGEMGVAPGRLRVVAPGVDPVEARVGAPEAEPRLLCVATLTPRKGHDLLLHALAPLTGLPWRLGCVGSLDRAPEWSAQMIRLCHALGLQDRVRFTDAVNDQELGRQYARSDLFVLPTRFEGYGMAVAEALAQGLPILTTRTGAAPDLVGSEAGILVPPDDRAALEAALGRLLTDPALRRHLAEGSLRAALGLPTWDQAIRAFAAACDSPREVSNHG